MFVHVCREFPGIILRGSRLKAVLRGEGEAGEGELLKLQKFSFAGKTFDNFFCAIVGSLAIVARSDVGSGKQTWRCFQRNFVFHQNDSWKFL